METTFYARVNRGAPFRRFSKGRILSTREHALLNLVCMHAEYELGTLAKELATKAAQLEGERFKTQVAYVFGRGGDALRRALGFLVTPYSNYVYSLPPPQSSIDVAASEVVPPEKPAAQVDPKSEEEKGKGLLGMLPDWAQGPIRLAADYLGKLSPLTTAILFFLVISGSVAFAEHEYGDIERTYKAAIEDNKRLAGIEEQDKKDKQTIQDQQDSVQSLTIKLEGLKGQLANLENTVADRDRELENKKKEYTAGLDLARTNLDVASKQAMSDKNLTISQLETDKASLQQAVARLKLDVAATAAATHEEDTKKFQSIIDDQRKRIDDLQPKANNFDDISSFTGDMLSAVKKYLLDSGDATSSAKRDFRKAYRTEYEEKRQLFEQLGFPRF